MRWETIDVGIDESDDSIRALGRAIVLAKTMNARKIVSSVLRTLPSGAAAHGLGPLDPANPPEEHRAALERIRRAVESEHIDVEYDLQFGDPAEALVELAERPHAHLIVVGTREPGFIDRLLTGSVSQAVARHSRCDVLIVH